MLLRRFDMLRLTQCLFTPFLYDGGSCNVVTPFWYVRAHAVLLHRFCMMGALSVLLRRFGRIVLTQCCYAVSVG